MAPAGFNEELPYLVLSKINFETFVRELLLVKSYRVEVFTTKKSGRANDWNLEYRGSPGNLVQFEELLFNNNEIVVNNSTIIGLQLRRETGQTIVGLACVDTTERKLFVSEFADNDFFAELEAVIVLLGPKECLLPSADGDFLRVRELMDRNNVMITVRKKTDFTVEKSDLVQDLNKLLHFEKGQTENADALPETTKTIAMSALGATLKYLELTTDESNLGNFQLTLLNLNRFVHLDSAAVSALNIFPAPGTSTTSNYYKWHSILGVLDRCRTPQGHRLLIQWLKQPLRDEAAIRDRLDIVECFTENLSAREDLHESHLKRLPDLLIIGKKLMKKSGSLQDIFRIYQVILRVPKILSLLNDLGNKTVASVLCNPLKDTLEDVHKYKEMVEQVLDLDGVGKGEYFVKASFDEQLQEFKDKMDDCEDNLKAQVVKAERDLEIENIRLEFVSHIGYHFRIPSKNDTIIRRNKKYKIIDAISSGIRFSSDRLDDLNADFLEAREAYEEHQKSIVQEIVKTACKLFSLCSILD